MKAKVDKLTHLRVPALLAIVSACSPPTQSVVSSTPRVCSVRLPPSASLPSLPATPLDIPLSEVVVGITFDTSALTSRLAKQVPARVAAARDVDAGLAGRLSYHIDRSPFSVALRERNLAVSTHLTSRADLCKPLGPLGCVPYAYCTPAADATASIPLSLGARYRLGPAAVSIRVTRPCTISSLGLDATPRIQAGANQQAHRIRDRIQRLLPSFEDDAGVLWRAMAVSVPLDVQTRLRIVPEQVVEGPPRLDRSVITIPLGVRGKLRIESRETEPEPAAALPRPAFDPTLEPGVSLVVPVEVDYESIAANLTRSVTDLHSNIPARKPRIVSLRVGSHGDDLLIVASISGRTCGDVSLLARPGFDATSSRLRLSNVRPAPGETARAHSVDPNLSLQTFVDELTVNASIPLPLDPFGLPRGVERAVAMLASDQGPEVRVNVPDTEVRDVRVTATGVATFVHVRGSAEVVLR